MPIDPRELSDIFAKDATDQFTAGFEAELEASNLESLVREISSTKPEIIQSLVSQSFRRPRKWDLGQKIAQGHSQRQVSLRLDAFESTVEFPYDAADAQSPAGQAGLARRFAEIARDAGSAAANHNVQLWVEALESSTGRSLDGAALFGTHAASTESQGGTNTDNSGSGPAWYIVDETFALKPIVHAYNMNFGSNRASGDLEATVLGPNGYVLVGQRPNFDSLFGRWSLEGQVGVQQGFWQGIYRSNLPMTLDNIKAARAAMRRYKREADAPLGVRPSALLVPTDLETDAEELLGPLAVRSGASINNSATIAGMRPVASPYLSNDDT